MTSRLGRGGPPQADRLPCGRHVDDLIEQVAEGHGGDLTEHQRACTHCRAFLAETATLWEPVSALAHEELRPPADLFDKVITRVRELAADAWFVLLPNDAGATRIAARALAGIAQASAARAAGVRAVLGRSSHTPLATAAAAATRSHRQPDSAVGIAGTQVVIDLALVTRYGARIPDVADDVRGRVLRALRALAGLRHVRVDITVDDVR
jgi:uncharacterized alkaline shock family protein YloU